MERVTQLKNVQYDNLSEGDKGHMNKLRGINFCFMLLGTVPTLVYVYFYYLAFENLSEEETCMAPLNLYDDTLTDVTAKWTSRAKYGLYTTAICAASTLILGVIACICKPGAAITNTLN